MCPRGHSTIRSNGVLRPDDVYMARALTVVSTAPPRLTLSLARGVAALQLVGG